MVLYVVPLPFYLGFSAPDHVLVLLDLVLILEIHLGKLRLEVLIALLNIEVVLQLILQAAQLLIFLCLQLLVELPL